MSRMNPLPPQAFTKDTLQKAYLWLNNQAPHVKELAATPELLVSLYLKAERNGEESLNRPSIQNFKNELKSLAGMIGDFENQNKENFHTQTIAEKIIKNDSASEQINSDNGQLLSPSTSELSLGDNKIETSTIKPANSVKNNTFHPQLSSKQQKLSQHPVLETDTFQLDAKSIVLIHEVKNQLNLGSETEALRLLITLGYSKAKNLGL